jgi:uncharacterized membrane protein YozB (DUF420 family)
LDAELLPRINATLNGISTLLLVAGFLLIRKKQHRAHAAVMVTALIVSAAFLVGYLVHKFYYPDIRLRERFPNLPEAWAIFYWFVVLIPHLVLAIAMLPMIFMAVWHAARQDFVRHKWWTRFTIWIWLYVSVTGVLIYALLYHVFPRLSA